MRYAALAVVVLAGCVSGPNERGMAGYVVQQVTSYQIGVTREATVQSDFLYPHPEPGGVVDFVEGRRAGVFEVERSRVEGYESATYWVGYRRYLPYDDYISDRRMYALTFVNGILRHIYSP